MLSEFSRPFYKVDPLSEYVFSSRESGDFFVSDFAGRSNVFVEKLRRSVDGFGAEKSLVCLGNNLKLNRLNDDFLENKKYFYKKKVFCVPLFLSFLISM